MNFALTFHTLVETDLSEAYSWYENKQQGLGERFLEELAACYGQLKFHPEYYGQVLKSYRKMVMRHFPYIIAFEIINDGVFVYAIFHTSRNPRRILKRRV